MHLYLQKEAELPDQELKKQNCLSNEQKLSVMRGAARVN